MTPTSGTIQGHRIEDCPRSPPSEVRPLRAVRIRPPKRPKSAAPRRAEAVFRHPDGWRCTMLSCTMGGSPGWAQPALPKAATASFRTPRTRTLEPIPAAVEPPGYACSRPKRIAALAHSKWKSRSPEPWLVLPPPGPLRARGSLGLGPVSSDWPLTGLIYIYIYIYTHTYISLSLSISLSLYIYIYIYLFIYVCIYIYIYTHIYIRV